MIHHFFYQLILILKEDVWEVRNMHRWSSWCKGSGSVFVSHVTNKTFVIRLMPHPHLSLTKGYLTAHKQSLCVLKLKCCVSLFIRFYTKSFSRLKGKGDFQKIILLVFWSLAKISQQSFIFSKKVTILTSQPAYKFWQ